MSMFHVGQKVVCVDDGWVTKAPIILPKKSVIYTIREIVFYTKPSLRLVEIVNAPHHFIEEFGEAAFVAARFRPVVNTDISIFTAMLNTTKQGADA